MKRVIKQHYMTVLGCFLISLLFCYPLLREGIIQGHDLLFHINRIQALVEAIQQGDWFPKLFYMQNFGFGYGTPLFYSNLFLYFPAILTVSGINLILSYKIFLFMCTFLSALSMKYLANSIFKNQSIQFLSVFLYIFSTFRITDVYVRGALGEILAFIFIPIVILAIHKMLFKFEYSWILLSFSFTGLLLSHNISFILACILFSVFFLVKINKMNKKLIVSIIKAIILSLCVSAFYLLPMIEQMQGGYYVVNGYFNISSLLHSTLYLEQLFKINITFGFLGHVYDLKEAAAINVGLVILLIPLLYPVIKRKSNFISISLLIGYFAIWMSTDYFPWKYFGFLGFIQFTWRVLIIALPLLVLASCWVIDNLFRGKMRKYSIILITLISLLIGTFQLFHVFSKETILSNITSFESSEYYRRGELSLGDYLPKNSTINYDEYGQYIETNNPSEILKYNKGYNRLEFEINEAKQNDFYTLPLIYYKGYEVKMIVSDSKEINIMPYPNENGLVSFRVPYEINKARFIVSYNETKIQILGNIISLISILLFIIVNICRRIKK